MPSKPQVWSHEKLEDLVRYHGRKVREYELAATTMCYHERKLAAAKSLMKYHERKFAEARCESRKLYQRIYRQVEHSAAKRHKKYHGRGLAGAMRMVAKLQMRSEPVASAQGVHGNDVVTML